jgi:conjugal transfer/entry exclusion protein
MVVAHRVLDQIELQIQHISQQSHISAPSNTTKCLHSELIAVWKVLANVRRQVTSVTTQKEGLYESCNSLERSLSEDLREPGGPVEYDSCECFHRQCEFAPITLY